jgi:AICAR transformylase/IMP cyclohydrolase PurH
MGIYMNIETKTERLSFDEVLEFIQEQMSSYTINLRCPLENSENCSYKNIDIETPTVVESAVKNNLQTAELVLTNRCDFTSLGTCLTSVSKNSNAKNKKLNRCKECYDLALRIQSINQ